LGYGAEDEGLLGKQADWVRPKVRKELMLISDVVQLTFAGFLELSF